MNDKKAPEERGKATTHRLTALEERQLELVQNITVLQKKIELLAQIPTLGKIMNGRHTDVK